jgi:hypothetical protein
MKTLLAGILTSGLLVLGCAPATTTTKSGPPGPRSGGAQGLPSQGAKPPGKPADGADKAKTTDELPTAHPDKDKDKKDK